MLKGISKGKIKKPVFMIVHGTPGVGKSTFAAEAPSPIFIASEDGTSHLDVSRFDDSSSWIMVNNNIKTLLTEDHKYKTLVIDSIDWIEPMLWKHVCEEQKVSAIEDSFGSYGKWVGGVGQVWLEFINKLKSLRDVRGMNIILIAHTMIKAFNDPTQTHPYDRYILKMQEKHAALFIEAVDVVLFANYDIVTQKTNKTDRKAKAFGGENRVLYTERRPAFEAKNRASLPFEMPLDWNTFYSAASAIDINQVRISLKEIHPLLSQDVAERLSVAVNNAGDDVTKLLQILNHARTLSNG